jgi:two-component system, sensor histidine kinase and response regulator
MQVLVPTLDSFSQVLPAFKWQALAAFLQKTATAAGRKAMLLSDRELSTPLPVAGLFALLVTADFCALLQAQQAETPDRYHTQLTFDNTEIGSFLQQLKPLIAAKKKALLERAIAAQAQYANEPRLPSSFILQLLAVIASDPEPTAIACEPMVAAAIFQQVEQERLLNQVTAQIRQSLELPKILKTAVEEVRKFVSVDRLLIFEFSPQAFADGTSSSKSALSSTTERTAPGDTRSMSANLLIPDNYYLQGRITYEAKASGDIPSVLDLADGCWFDHESQTREKYSQGIASLIPDIEEYYHQYPCLLKLLQHAQVRAKLVTPIRVQEKLWGLLIAHQCYQPRQWQLDEEKFLGQIAQHLAIAIYQATLYHEVQQQKQTLEERVAERTQALAESLAATQSANRVKSDFLATMSHELRTPLTCVIGMSATLLRWSLGPLNDKQRSYLKTIHDSGEHLLELINDILDFSQVESGKTVLQMSEFSLSQLTRQCLQVFREKARAGNIDLKIQISVSAERDRFTADQRRVRQILFNLLANAIKFTPEGGTVTLRVWVESKTAVFQVEDTGIGIPAEQQPQLFQKFQQLDMSYKRRYEGAGLGLALTKQLVDLHHGWLSVESAEGKGSVFTVEIPAQELNAEEVEGDSTSRSSPSAGRVVLIEDDEDSAALVCDLLTAAGYQVVWMIEPSTAVEQIQFLQPTAVITALEMSGMNGLDIVRRIRQHPVMQHIKVLALTHQSAAESHDQDVGADAYLSRPIDPGHLLHKVAALIALAAS